MNRRMIWIVWLLMMFVGTRAIFVTQLLGDDVVRDKHDAPSVTVLPVYSMPKGHDFFFRIDFQNTGQTSIRYVDTNGEVGFLNFPLYRDGNWVPYAVPPPQVMLHESYIRELKPGEFVAHKLSIATYKRLSKGRYQLRFRYFTYKSRYGFTPIDVAETPIAWIEVTD